jgi:hypothetical protein
MTPPKVIRKKVLEALKMADGYDKTEAMILEIVKTMTGGDAGRQEVRDAMDRHHVEAFIRSEKDVDNEVTWYLTPEGRAELNRI